MSLTVAQMRYRRAGRPLSARGGAAGATLALGWLLRALPLWAMDSGPAARDMLTDMRGMLGAPRTPGSPGNLALQARVVERFQQSGFMNGALRFQSPVFHPGAASLRLAGGEPVAIEAMHPTLMRPGNFAEPAFAARLVYLGRGTYEDLERVRGLDLRDAIALMEFDCGDRWTRTLRFGIRGFIFIGTDRYAYADSLGKVYNTEAAVPRFFVPAEAGGRLRDACQGSASPEVTIQSAPSRWENAELCDPWVLIPGSDPELSQEVVVFTAPLDANSVVPERAVGAQSAGNLYLLLQMLDAFKRKPPARSVLLAAVNAHTEQFLGERILAWHLLAGTDEVESIRSAVARDMRVAGLFADKYKLLKLEPTGMSGDDLKSWMAILWQLDAKQEAQRQAEQKKAEGGKKAAAIDIAALEALGDTPLETLRRPEVDSVLDLAPFTLQDYRDAADRVVANLEAERKGLLFRMFAEEEAGRQLEEDVRRIQSLKTLTFEEMTGWATRAKPVFDDEKLIEKWRSGLDSSTGDRLPIKKELQDEAKRSHNKLKLARLGIVKNDALSKEEQKRTLEILEARQKDMLKVLRLFNKIELGIGRKYAQYHQIAASGSQLEILRSYRDLILTDFTARHDAKEKMLSLDSANDALRDILGRRKTALVVNLDINWRYPRVGLCSVDPGVANDWQLKFAKACAAIANQLDGKPARRSSTNAVARASGTKKPLPITAEDEDGLTTGVFVDSMSRLIGSKLEPYFFASTLSPIPFFHAAQATPAVAVKSVFASHAMAFSPADTFDQLDAGAMLRLQTWLLSYFRALLADPVIFTPKIMDPLEPYLPLWSTVIRTFTLDQFAGNAAPDRPVANCLVALYATEGLLPPVDGEVVNCYRGMTDHTGATLFYGLRDGSVLAPAAYQLDGGGVTALYDVDKGQVQDSLQLSSDVLSSQPSRTLPMFPCTEFTVYDRVDPTLVSDIPITVQQFWPISAYMRDSPQKYGTHGLASLSVAKAHESAGPASVSIWRKDEQFKPERLMLLTGQKRAALNATATNPEGEGFGSEREMGQDFFAWVARDMEFMNRKRLAEMKGVANELVGDFLAEGKRALDEMQRALATRDRNGFVLANYKAVGSETKAYEEICALNADMLKAILLYMGLMLPFCFFLEKLIFRFTKIEHDMLAFSLMFVATYVVFRFIHPAFRVAKNPEAIFIAFTLGAIGCFVIYVLRQRFDTEMQLLFRSAAGMESDVATGTVGQLAMLIGVNNMKRRRVRTTLTMATIVLVVFTMLAFSSVSKKMQPTLIAKSDEAPYTGMFYQWPEGAPMDEETAAVFNNIFGGRADVIVRRVLSPAQPMLLYPLARPESRIDVDAVVGLAMAEDGFLGHVPVIRGRYFSSPLAREIILPSMAAAALKIRPDDVGKLQIRLLGEDLTLVGILDDDRYLMIRDLDPSRPLLPNRKGASQEEAKDTKSMQGGDFSSLVVDTAALAILPAELAAKLGARPFSISIRFPDDPGGPGTDIWKEVSLLLNITRAKFHVASQEAFKVDRAAKSTVSAGTYYVGSSYRVSIGGLARLLIPLLIAGSIIFNTMLGTVYERKHEIAIFNAVGLNPTHIFLFFLAEAFVYSVIGAVGGYLIGQVLAMALSSLNLIQGVNVNFSSLMVGYAILFTIALVLLSTIYPGLVATRTAVPSSKRRWSLPRHDGNRMQVAFPFIYMPELASGVMYYLHEYFSAFTEHSLGDKVVTLQELTAGTDPAGRPVFRLKYGVALAPYDLGVTQTVDFVTCYADRVKSYQVHLAVARVSGQDTYWSAVNKPFLEKLRKLLMRWRSLDPAQHAWYVKKGNELFKTGGAEAESLPDVRQAPALHDPGCGLGTK